MDVDPPAWEPPDDRVWAAVNKAADDYKAGKFVDGAAAKYSKPPRTPDSRPFLAFDAASWLEKDIEPRPWLAQGYVLRKAVTAIIGAGAAGKSSLMVAWTIALALGEQFHRLKPRQPCRVMTFNTEDDEAEQRRRFSAALRRAGRVPSDLDGKVIRVGAQRVGTLFGKAEDGIIDPLPAMNELRAQLIEFRPDVLILDPLVELHDVDENANSDMREVMAMLRSLAVEFNMAVVVAHHTRKGVVVPGDPEAARGASAVKDLCRVALTLTVMQAEDAKAFNIAEDKRHLFFRLDDAKQNYSAMRETEWFERLVYQLDNDDWVAAAGPWLPPIDVVTPDKRAAVEAGLAQGTGDGPYSPKLDKSARSFKALCTENGIVTSDGQKQLLEALIAVGGYTVRKFKKPSNSGVVQGIRCPDGRPRTAAWVDDETDYGGDE